MSVIETRGLRKQFTVRVNAGWLRRRTRVVAAVDGIDLTVERGEMVGYIGPNGAGKSTTLKMLTGVLYPSAGHVRVCGLEAGDTTIVLTTHDLADIERLCRRLIVIDQGRLVHDGSLDDLHARYGSRRRLVVDLDEPLKAELALPGVTVESSQADGRRITYALDGTTTAGDLVCRLAELAALRDISVLEPAIEDVVARLYTRQRG